MNLPQTFDPFDFAKKRQNWQGVWTVKNVSNLSNHIVGEDLVVKVSLQGDIDPQGFSFVKGAIKGQLQLTCQRCLEPMDKELDLSFCLSPVGLGKDAELPELYEALMLDNEGLVSLGQMIEEEIILGLPLIPKHDSDCGMAYNDGHEDTKISPFDILKQKLRNDKKQ